MTQAAKLFSVALNMVLQGTVAQGNIARKCTQICACSDEIDVIACDITAFEQTLLASDNEGRRT
jgi:hypothetical protein